MFAEQQPASPLDVRTVTRKPPVPWHPCDWSGQHRVRSLPTGRRRRSAAALVLGARWALWDWTEAGEQVASAAGGQAELAGAFEIEHAAEQSEDGTGWAVQDEVRVGGAAEAGVDLAIP